MKSASFRISAHSENHMDLSPQIDNDWYHGTTESNAQAIEGEDNWIIPGRRLPYDRIDRPRTDSVYITRDLDNARSYAEQRSRSEENSPAVLRVRPDPTAQLYPDEDVVFESLNNTQPDELDKRVRQIWLDQINQNSQDDPAPTFAEAWQEFCDSDNGIDFSWFAESMKELTEHIVLSDPKLAQDLLLHRGRGAHLGKVKSLGRM